MTLPCGFPASHFRHFGRKASCHSFHPGDLPPSALYPTCPAAYGTSRFPNHSPSSTAHPACHSASSPPGLTRCSPCRPSRTTPCSPCLSLCTSHVFLQRSDVQMCQHTLALTAIAFSELTARRAKGEYGERGAPLVASGLAACNDSDGRSGRAVMCVTQSELRAMESRVQNRGSLRLRYLGFLTALLFNPDSVD